MKRQGEKISHAFHIRDVARAGFKNFIIRLRKITGSSEEENWGRNGH
jgi:hypothetical protein